MLDEREWEQVAPELVQSLEQIKHYRQTHGTSLEESKDEIYWQGALARYKEITGSHDIDPQVLWHHRLGLYGPPCRVCGKPLRTPRAKLCAECGAPADQSQS
jgi:hypothetical protein